MIRVIDGDTLTVGTPRGAVRARLLGIDAPEASALRYGRPDCGGQATTDALRRVARPGVHVRLVSDPRSGDVKDAHGRTLAYVDGPNGDLGEAQLRAGLAVIYRYHGRRFSRLPRYDGAAPGAVKAAMVTRRAHDPAPARPHRRGPARWRSRDHGPPAVGPDRRHLHPRVAGFGRPASPGRSCASAPRPRSSGSLSPRC